MPLSPADQIKLKALMAEAAKKLGKEKLSELLDLTEQSEGEQDEQGEQQAPPQPGMNAGKVYPNQGQQ